MARTTRSSEGVRRDLLTLSPRRFEEFIADVWQERQGWTTEVLPRGQDGGIDVIGVPPGGGAKTALQAKRYAPSNPVGRPEVQQYASLTQEYRDIGAVTIVTTGRFTDGAQSAAARLDVKCIDGDALVDIIRRERAHDILAWYKAGKPAEWP